MGSFTVDYLAILISSIAAFAIGAIWYSPALFFKPWSAAVGKTEEDLKKGVSPFSYVVTFLAGLWLFMFWQEFFGMPVYMIWFPA